LTAAFISNIENLDVTALQTRHGWFPLLGFKLRERYPE